MSKCLKCGNKNNSNYQYCEPCRVMENSFKKGLEGGEFVAKGYHYERKLYPKIYHVYFIQDPRTRCIKIGMAKDIVSRAKTLQIGTPIPLKILGYISCYQGKEEAQKLEKALHLEYRRFNVQGEWFNSGLPLEEIDFKEWKGNIEIKPKCKYESYAKSKTKNLKRQKNILKNIKKKAEKQKDNIIIPLKEVKWRKVEVRDYIKAYKLEVQRLEGKKDQITIRSTKKTDIVKFRNAPKFKVTNIKSDYPNYYLAN